MKWNANRIESRRGWAADGNGRVHRPEEISMPPSKEAICAVIVTYHPDGGVFSRTERVARQVGQVVIVDNGSPDSSVSYLRRLSEKLQAHLILNCRNQGIASALNQGVRWAAEQGYSWALTLDQDSLVAHHMVDSLAEVYRASRFQAELAIIGSNFRSSGNGEPFYDFAGMSSTLGKEVKIVATSGSLVSVQTFLLIGGFRDEFFIDCVDLEYCLRARAHGFRVMIACRPLMEHSIGCLSEHRLPWKKTGTSNHTSWRHYFMARNTMILTREYIREEPGWVLATLWSRTKSILLMCLFEKNRVRKIGYSLLGGLDGVRGKTNRFRGSAPGN